MRRDEREWERLRALALGEYRVLARTPTSLTVAERIEGLSA